MGTIIIAAYLVRTGPVRSTAENNDNFLVLRTGQIYPPTTERYLRRLPISVN